MTLLQPRIRYAISVGLSLIIVLAHIYAGVTTPFEDAWAIWIASVVFAVLLATMVVRSPSVLRVARWICYIGLTASVISMIVGLVGVLVYSMDLAVYLAIGLSYAFMLGVNLASVREAGLLATSCAGDGDI